MKKLLVFLLGIMLLCEAIAIAAPASPALIRKYIVKLEIKLAKANKDNDATRADKLQKMVADEKKRLAELEEVVGFPNQAPGTKNP